MCVKAFFKLFIPPVFIKLKNHILNSAHKSKSFISTISRINKSSNELIVIGNGPSLKQSLEKYEDKIKSRDCIVVNHFCETDDYIILQPKFYLLADPAFFGDLNNYAEWLKNKISKFIENLVLNTKWDINLIVPSIAFGSEFIVRVTKNHFIHPYYYNASDICEFEKSEKFKLWDKNLLSAPAQTCLNTCLWLGIFLRYKEIYLVGTDTTWIELLHVDQETNEVYTIDSHFYGQKKMPLYKDVDGKVPVKLHEELDSISNALKQYWNLKDYADYAGVKVYNASEYSLIDAFARKKL